MPLRHALEVRHESFAVPEFVGTGRQIQCAAIVYADHFTYPAIADVTSDFVYLRLQKGDDSIPTAYPREAMETLGGYRTGIGRRRRAGRTTARCTLPGGRKASARRFRLISFMKEKSARHTPRCHFMELIS
jgi:hypothetical protein